MKRLHLKRKPPKVKRLVCDGSSAKTKYVRMTPVIEDTVKREKGTKPPVSTGQPLDFLLEGASINTEVKKTYSDRKKKIIEAWDRLRPKLLTTRIEELLPATDNCCLCGSLEQEIVYCQDCGPTAYYCVSCCSRIHKNILFHKPQQWKDSIFVPIKITNEIHRKDHDCESSYMSTLYAVDVRGTQHICTVQLCRCEEPAVTLLRYNLWPATPSNPRIGFDIRFMELLAVLQLECHLPAKSFCEALGFMRSNLINLATDVEKNIYRAVVGDCLTEYNYHRSCLNTRNTITDSTFAMECPICLKNPPIVSMDANFGLVHKSSSGDGHGRHSSRHKNLYFLDHGDLKKFIDDYAVDNKNLNSECSNFQAGNIIRSKNKNKKLDVTGIFGSVCKHDIPIYFADLSHGERLSYPVYILKCILENRTDPLVVMYDIACMLHKHLKRKKTDDILQKCTFAVPVFHSFAHNTACQLTYGQRYADCTGLTDGEGIERLWSYLRSFKRITKEMSINNRQDLLTEAMIHHTEKQIWNMGTRIASKKARCEKLISDTEKVITEILEESKETVDVIDVWKADWKVQCHRYDKKGSSLSVDEQYVECLQQIETKEQLCKTAETEEARSEAEKIIERLLQDCKKLQKKCTNKEVQLQTEQGQALLASAKKKKRIVSLTKLTELATDRQYLSSLMKKYAEGQGIGLRISRQFAVNYSKMKKEIDFLNSIEEGDRDVKFFLSPSSTAYDELTTRKLSNTQQRAVETKSLLEHAKEEYEKINLEITTFLHYLITQSNEILQLIDTLHSSELSRLNKGKLQYLYMKHLNIEILSHSCMLLFEDIVPDVVEVPGKVHDILAAEILTKQTETSFPSPEELSSIMEEIENFENNPVFINRDDGDDDDYEDDEEEDEEQN